MSDDLERQLRAVLRSRRLSIDPEPDALERIHAGARKRQRRRAAGASGLAAIAVVGLVAAGLTLGPTTHHASVAGGGSSSASEIVRTPTPSPLVSANPGPPTTSVTTGPPPSGTGWYGFSPRAGTLPAGGAPPKGFTPISVTAISAKTYWVLGHAPCDGGVCTGVAKTTDAGKTFTEVGAPTSPLVPDAVGNKDVFGAATISDIRFGDGTDGWAYGGGLWHTTDGGATWSMTPIDGTVQQLAAANGHAWAIVNTGDGPTYQLFTATYPGGAWKKVGGVGDFGPAEPALAVQGKTVVVLGVDATTGKARAVRSTDAATFAPLPAPPCGPAPGEPLSPTAQGLWLACSSASGAQGGVFYSPDFGASWKVASSSLDDARVAIGAVDEKSAIVSAGGKLVRVEADGSTASITAPTVPAATTWTFIGFTTTDDGFAIPSTGSARQLWRTTDGGAHWSVVTVGGRS